MTLDAADISAIAQQVARTLYPSGRAWFVSKTGNDANDGLSWNTAKLTIGFTPTGGDSIFVGPGQFNGAIDFTGIDVHIVGAGYGASGTIIFVNSGTYALITGDGSRISGIEVILNSSDSEGITGIASASSVIRDVRVTVTNATGIATAIAVDADSTIHDSIITAEVAIQGACRVYNSDVSGTATAAIFQSTPTSSDTSDLADILAVIQTQTDKIGAGNIIALDPVINGGIRVVQGDSYTNTGQGRALTFTQLSGGNWPDNLLSAGSWSVKLKANRRADLTTGDESMGPITGTIVDANNVRFELTAAQTDGLATGNACYEFQIQAENGSERATLVTGTMTVTKDQNTA